MTGKVRQPNPITVICYCQRYSGKSQMHPYNFDLDDAKKLQEWITRTIKSLEQKQN